MKIINYLFPERTKWIDVGMFIESGKYKLTQMRSGIQTNKKEFRTIEISFVNNPTYFDDMKESILNK